MNTISPYSDGISSNDHGYKNGVPKWLLGKKEKVPESLTRLKNAISADIAIKDKMQYIMRHSLNDFVPYYSKEETMEFNREEFLRFEEATLPENVEIFVIESIEQLEEGLKYAFLTGRPKYVGFDCEWLPKNHKKRIDLVQLAFENCVLLIRLCKRAIEKEQIPALLKEVLEDEKVLKFCQDPEYEVNLLKMLWDIDIKGMIDTARIGDLFCCRPFGLLSLVALFLSKRLRKDPLIQCSNWESESLSIKQKNYAAVDAWISKQVALNMLEKYAESWKLNSIEEAIDHIRVHYPTTQEQTTPRAPLKRKAVSSTDSNQLKKIKTDIEEAPLVKKAKTEAQILRRRRKQQKRKARRRALVQESNNS